MPSPKRNLAAALGIATLLGATGLAHADWTLISADFKEQPHLGINTWTPTEGLSATDQSGKLITIPSRDILSLSSNQPLVSDPASHAWRLVLRNGDTLYGQATSVSGKSLMFNVPELGPLALPLKRVATLSAPSLLSAAALEKAAHRLPPTSDRDIILFKEGGDRLEGLFAAVDDTKLQFLSEGATDPADIPLAKVDTIVFGGLQPPHSVPPLSIRLTFTKSASVLTIPLDAASAFSWTLKDISFKDSAGQLHTTNADVIAKAEILGGRVVYLTQLDPDREEQVSFLGSPWPFQINKNVLGQPLRIGRTTYDRGIGVHTQSTLTYTLDGSFDTLSLRVGLDDSAAPNGEAHAFITLDGKTLWDGGNLKPGELSKELSLPVKGGKRLDLHADPASRLDVQGRVDWIDAALRRN